MKNKKNMDQKNENKNIMEENLLQTSDTEEKKNIIFQSNSLISRSSEDNPMYNSLNKETPSQTPETPSQTPETPSQTPETPSQIPETPSQTPETPSQTPETPSQIPETPSQTPETPSQTPETPSQTPETFSQTTESDQFIQNETEPLTKEEIKKSTKKLTIELDIIALLILLSLVGIGVVAYYGWFSDTTQTAKIEDITQIPGMEADTEIKESSDSNDALMNPIIEEISENNFLKEDSSNENDLTNQDSTVFDSNAFDKIESDQNESQSDSENVSVIDRDSDEIKTPSTESVPRVKSSP